MSKRLLRRMAWLAALKQLEARCDECFGRLEKSPNEVGAWMTEGWGQNNVTKLLCTECASKPGRRVWSYTYFGNPPPTEVVAYPARPARLHCNWCGSWTQEFVIRGNQRLYDYCLQCEKQTVRPGSTVAKTEPYAGRGGPFMLGGGPGSWFVWDGHNQTVASEYFEDREVATELVFKLDREWLAERERVGGRKE